MEQPLGQHEQTTLAGATASNLAFDPHSDQPKAAVDTNSYCSMDHLAHPPTQSWPCPALRSAGTASKRAVVKPQTFVHPIEPC